MHHFRILTISFTLLLFPGLGHSSSDLVHRAKLVLSLAGTAEPQHVSVELRTGDDDVRRVVAPLPGELSIDVPPGATYIRVVSDAYWTRTHAFDVNADGQVLALDVHPAGVVSGTATLGDGNPALPAANAIFIGSERLPPWSKSTVVPCSVTALRWSCVVPAGVHDLRLRVPGYVSAYFAKTIVGAGKRLDLGEVKLVRGASLVGSVTAIGAPRNARPLITIEPLRLATFDDEGATLRSDSVRADERGFFHFDGVAPGTYSVIASLPGYAPAKGSAQVVQGRESEMPEPLVIEKAKRFELSISPPLDFSGKPWIVTVRAQRPGSFHELLTQGAAGADGEFTWTAARGTYEVAIASGDGRTWREESVRLDGNPTRAHLAIEPRRIRGTVLLGGQPLRAKLAFQQRTGPEAESNADGEFTALVPPAQNGAWRVTVTSESAGVNREVSVRAPEEGDDVRISLPGARIAGIVTDERGTGVEDAIVTVVADNTDRPRRTQVRSGPGGVFRAAALDGDRYRLSAEARAGESDVVHVTLSEDEDRRIEIVLHPWQMLHGTVSSAHGPASGAELYIQPLQGAASKPLIYTDATGSFKATVPPGTDTFDLAVSAPGFARSFFRIPWQKGRKLHLSVDQIGGALTIDVPKSMELPITTWVHLVRGDARILLGLAQRWGIVQSPSAPDRYTLVVPQMEPGAYRLCATPAGGLATVTPFDPNRCVSGVLAPYGQLTLRLD